ncbi:hypothetical protein NQ318_000665 [Aromia moschata]|uniref:Uncharacterized protein n=1 Tax=Aromia moschata TaxID=1265417 RepID=A0AAV8Y029_9CUCU|nr:hypothetical protein NQ318_000665 [Aromia moschata]
MQAGRRPDLDAIGVFNPVHRGRLLQSVRTLREEGAASRECPVLQDVVRPVGEGDHGVHHGDEQDRRVAGGVFVGGERPGGGQVLDEYEEGKAELVKIPRLQLKVLLREKLSQDGIRLSCQPYSTPTFTI